MIFFSLIVFLGRFEVIIPCTFILHQCFTNRDPLNGRAHLYLILLTILPALWSFFTSLLSSSVCSLFCIFYVAIFYLCLYFVYACRVVFSEVLQTSKLLMRDITVVCQPIILAHCTKWCVYWSVYSLFRSSQSGCMSWLHIFTNLEQLSSWCCLLSLPRNDFTIILHIGKRAYRSKDQEEKTGVGSALRLTASKFLN